MGTPVADMGDDNSEPSKFPSSVLDIERIEHNLYRASDHWGEFESKQLYGGLVVSQALVAASKTVQPELNINSLHCYFTHKGNPQVPVLYRVESLRDGRSFSTRTVHAIQNGQTILVMIVSFHAKEESPFNHQATMPQVPLPENLLSVSDLVDKYFSAVSEEVKTKIRRIDGSGSMLEYRHVDAKAVLMRQTPADPRCLVWVRVKGTLGGDERVHRCAAAYISDVFLAWTAYMPHRHIRKGLIASLDHSVWFHAPFRADEWMLYEIDSPKTGASRGMSFGRLWRRDGTLVVSTSQECVMRPKL
ncbi:acyl-coenzyme A thioesterase 8-like [Acanthaster planci]|uniref:Acyl-coenzyme A thioesterase 8-like n=1 Tax=Acanthaster planci TaxID=133434 RepID=A0A8B7XJB7_ACAPL|nr:acyl-coenzyme A thioesterase 8-like [Acanthaster planci]XP_022080282.1 acyl-coenzyme A thioesterase 8-like [Acanthaster planci]XP_022080283.1 acyl-coenzyme A thioesterase 8-like [Acanthaster planci]XP_022080284.1 acyl-coenzyme A thioesterase 8-like [Acanthaster planci]XP_022080285.1 acyl-coenzyme A thioesterase 8-like [Acanthaster planci]